MTDATPQPKSRLKKRVYVAAAIVGLAAYGMFLMAERENEQMAIYRANRAKGYTLVAEFEGCKVYRNGRYEVVTVGSPGVVCTYQ